MAERVTPETSVANYWLFVTDPNEYSFDDLLRDTATVWDGVEDYTSLSNLRDVEPNEEILVFHSGTEWTAAIVVPQRGQGSPSWRWTSSPCAAWSARWPWRRSRTCRSSRTST